MGIFTAWVVVGICCYFIERNNRYKHLGKDALVEGFFFQHPDAIDQISKEQAHRTLEFIVCLVSVVIAPYSLICAIKHLFKPKDYNKLKTKLMVKKDR